MTSTKGVSFFDWNQTMRFAFVSTLFCCCLSFACTRDSDKQNAALDKSEAEADQSVAGTVTSPDTRDDPFGSVVPREPQTRIEIVLTRDDRGDEDGIEVNVKNASSVPVGWDRLCSTFVKWDVVDDAGHVVPSRDVDAKGDQLPRDRERFVTLQPGESFNTRVSLASGVLGFRSARFVGSTGGAGAVGREERRLFDFSVAKMSCRARLHYDAADFDAEDGFAVYFGFRPTDVGIDFDRVDSNVVVIDN